MSSSEPALGATARWRLDLAYDGAGLHGFAEQPGRATVIGELRDALTRTLRLSERPSIVGAGRTDAGVHALAQVIHVDLPTPLYRDDRGDSVTRMMRSLNSQLAGRVVVLSAHEVPNTFHARFSATARAYRYLVVESASPPLDLTSRFAWTVIGRLDLDLMNETSRAILGTHDFRAFCRRPAGAKGDAPLMREVREAQWRRLHDELSLSASSAPVVRFDITANAFCHQMVRSLVGAMVAVGKGSLSPKQVAERLVDPSRARLPSPAPAAGLALVAVEYGELAPRTQNFVS